ncbi:MAG TPA: sodium:solute symporter [Vicinamibacterales bacterium]|nr:sodium:solute symporter [Vicinamibacterales bacterium]
MHWIDWVILIAYLVWIVLDGLRQSRKAKGLEGYFLASRSIPWWAVGLSVMATQLSAITMIGTTGQGYVNGMRFIQFYYGLPLAMLILSVTLVPFFHNARVFTAYEYLERRFDAKTRSLTAFLFLISRAMSCGAVISAPAVVLSVIMGVNVTTTCLLMGVPTAIYTMFGGVQAVTWTDVKQMYLIVFGLVAAFIGLVVGLPDNISLADAFRIAGSTGRLQTFDWRFDVTNDYTFWSGTIAAVFLFTSYFGTDQSQVQRYLTARSVDEGRISLFMSAYWKIPLQALVLAIGVLMFVFFLFTPPPLLFNRAHDSEVLASPRASEYGDIEQQFQHAVTERGAAAEQYALARRAGNQAASAFTEAGFKAWDQEVRNIRASAVAIVREVSGDVSYNDVNFVFPTFVTMYLPVGLVGAILAAIFAAAMSTISAELASLSTATVIDFYRRWIRSEADDHHFLRVSRVTTGFWGVFASVIAIWSVQLGSLIEVVNRFGSYFYGSILGVFLLAIWWKRANGHGAFAGVIAGMIAVGYVATSTKVAFLWLNVVGAVSVFLVGVLVSELFRTRGEA